MHVTSKKEVSAKILLENFNFCFHILIFFSSCILSLFLAACGSMRPQPAPASAGEESEEDQQFRTIFQEIAGDVSTGST